MGIKSSILCHRAPQATHRFGMSDRIVQAPRHSDWSGRDADGASRMDAGYYAEAKSRWGTPMPFRCDTVLDVCRGVKKA